MSIKTNSRISILALCLFLAFGLSNCKKDPIEEPIVYNFDDEFKDLKVEEVTQTEPTPVAATEAEATDSETETAATAALESGTVTTELRTAVDATAAIVTEDQAETLSEAISAGATLTTEQQSQVNALLSSSSFAAFLPTIVQPTVNGQVISARKGDNSVKILNLKEMLLGISDACTDAAAASLAKAKTTLDAAKASQDAKINATLTTRQASILATHTASLATISTKWTNAKATARAENVAIIAIITANNLSNYLKLIFNLILKEKLAACSALESAAINAANAVRDQANTNATNAKNWDLAAILVNYNKAINTATAKAAVAAATCHNQGAFN
jgi:hypothetical protein